MERFLLFDSGCSLCSGLARDIERESGGRLVARSLREPEMKALLDRARPGWHWEPTLLEVEVDRVRAFTGLAMRTQLVNGLGLRRAWRLAQLVQRAGVPVLDLQISRRHFFKHGAQRWPGSHFSGHRVNGEWERDLEAMRQML